MGHLPDARAGPRILREGVPLRLGATVRTLDRVDGPVRVEFEGAASGEYDLVVGADTWSAMFGRDATFLTIPIGEGTVYCYADVGNPGPPAGDPVAALRERFAGFAAPVPELLEGLDRAELHAAPIEEVRAECWGRGAVALTGDAAHGMSPNMAEGASLAFEDALELAACLRDAGSIGTALARFAARRTPRTSWVRARTHRRDRTRGLQPALRNLVLRNLAGKNFPDRLPSPAHARRASGRSQT